MKLSEEVKNKIIEILDSQEFKSNLYEGLTEEKRKELLNKINDLATKYNKKIIVL